MFLMPGYFGDGFRDLSFVEQKPVLSKRKTLSWKWHKNKF